MGKRVFISGSSDGLGLLASRQLAEQGHAVTLHARNDARAGDARRALPQAEALVTGDLSSIAATRSVADQLNALGRYDAVIHNAGVGYQEPRTETVDGLEHIFAINVLAPYLLTALMTRPDRLVYMSSGMHTGGNPDLRDPQWKSRAWNGSQAYSDSKLYDTILAFAIARHWPDVFSNSVDPGWVPTKMGGSGAPDDLALGAATQAWLAVSGEPEAKVSGRHFRHQKPLRVAPAAQRHDVQDALLAYCAGLTSVKLSSSI